MKKIKSHVFKQVSKQRTSLKGGQGMKALGAHLYTNFPSVPPPPLRYHVIFAAKSAAD